MKCIEIATGSIFGRLTVIEKAGAKNRHMFYKCKCICGNVRIIRGSGLASGNTESCGCKGKEQIRRLLLSKRIKGVRDETGKITPEYGAWRSIKSRCYKKTNPKYKNYGGRGIKVCDRWLYSFTNFLDDMGERPKHCTSIDRIDVNGNYEPTNCRWATEYQQACNKTNTIRILVNGTETHQAGLAKKLGVTSLTIHNHLEKGKTGDEIVEYFKKKNQYATAI